MALIDMKSDLSQGVGSKQTPQSFTDGHSGTLVTGNKSFDIPPRFDIQTFKISAQSRQSEQLNFQFNETFNTPGQSIVDKQVPELQEYYDRAFSQTDPLGARSNRRFGPDEPFILKEIGDRWGPGGAGAIDFGLVRGGAITQAARTVADIERIGKFLITPRGVAFVTKQTVLQSMNAGVRERFGVTFTTKDSDLPDNVPQGTIAAGDDRGGMRARKNRGMDLSQQFGFTKYRNSPSVGFVDGSNLRVWRPTSVIDSLPIGAHAVRHLEPPGLPLGKIIDEMSNFVTKGADGLTQIRPETKIEGNVTAGVTGTFPSVDLPKVVSSPVGSLSDFFPSLIDIPTIPTPDFSGFKNLIGGLVSSAGSLASKAAKGVLGGISIPDVSLPNLGSKIPKLPDLQLPPVVTNVFSAIGEVASFITPPIGKFTGTGGLGIGVSTNPVLTAKLDLDVDNLTARITNPTETAPYGEDSSRLTNLYSDVLPYSKVKIKGLGDQQEGLSQAITFADNGDRVGSLATLGIDVKFMQIGPLARQAGFYFGSKFGGEIPNKTQKKARRITRFGNSTDRYHVSSNEEKYSDKLGRRLQKYNLKSYGELKQDNGYGYSSSDKNADITRGLGSQGAASRIQLDENGNVVKSTGTGGYKNELVDKVNLHPYGGSTVDANINNTEMDFIPLKFRDMVNGKWIIFRAILESVADTSSPEFAEEKFIGRPEKVYTYQGATRNVNVTFKVMPKSLQELITLWEKLNYLRGLSYPTIRENRMVAPFFDFTLGDMFDRQPMYFSSLNYTIDTQSTWEIKPGLRLPKLIQVSADMRFIEKRLPQTTGKHYDLNWLDGDLEYGTFKDDPAGEGVLAPNRKGYEALFNELGMGTLTKSDIDELIAGQSALEAAQKELEEQISNVNNSSLDIPRTISDLGRF